MTLNTKRQYASVAFWLLLVLLQVQCDEPDFPKSAYAKISTLPVSEVTTDGVVLAGNLEYLGTSPIVSYGFIYGTQPALKASSSIRVDLGAPPGTGVFEKQVRTGLYADSTYYVKTFASTSTVTVFGNVEVFTSEGSGAPVILALDPPEGTGGDTIIVRGTGLAFQPSKTIVKFGTSFYGEAIANSDTAIQVIVPRNIPGVTVPVAVTIAGKTGTAPAPFTLLVPQISGFSPGEITFDGILTIQGTHFDPNKEFNAVFVDGLPMEVVQASGTQLLVKISSAAIDQRENEVVVRVDQRADTAGVPLVLKAPVVSGITPTSGLTGTTVQISGSMFNPIASGNKVYIGGRSVDLLTASATHLSVRIPADGIFDARIQAIEVVTAGQSVFSAESFELTDPWLRKANIPSVFGIGGPISFAVNGKGYFGLGSLLPSGDILTYDPIQNDWLPGTVFPGSNKINGTSFVIGNKAYVGLGNSESNDPFADFWAFEPSSGQWAQVADFPYPASSAKGFSWNGYGYVITRELTANFWRYDPVGDTWTQLQDFEGNGAHWIDAGFVIGNKLYTLAADYSTGPEMFFVFDFLSGQWTRLNDVTTQSIHYGFTGFTVLGSGYLHGGNHFFKYDEGTDTWTDLEGIGGSLEASSFVINDKAYLNPGYSTIRFYEYNPLYQ